MSQKGTTNAEPQIWLESDEQNTCWICGKPTRQIKNVTLSHERFAGIRGRGIETEVSYIRIPVFVCEDCRKEDEQTAKKVANIMMISGGILGLITAVTGFLLLDKEFWTIPVGAIVGFIWGLIIGLVVGKVYEFIRKKRYMQGKQSLKDHPAIRNAYERGYKL